MKKIQGLQAPHGATSPPPNGDQPESQGSFELSGMPPSTSILPHEKLQVLTNKVFTISM